MFLRKTWKHYFQGGRRGGGGYGIAIREGPGEGASYKIGWLCIGGGQTGNSFTFFADLTNK